MPTIVVVDDHPTFRATACALLEAEGFVVVGEAADGLTALEVIERLAPDVVLLDVQLPDIDGFEVAARARGFDARAADRAHLEPRCARLRLADRRLLRVRLHREVRALGRGHHSLIG